jgi:hypothetical protein
MSSSIVTVPHRHPNVMTTLALATILVVAYRSPCSSPTWGIGRRHRLRPTCEPPTAQVENSWPTRTGGNQMSAGRRPLSPSTGDRSGAYQNGGRLEPTQTNCPLSGERDDRFPTRSGNSC